MTGRRAPTPSAPTAPQIRGLSAVLAGVRGPRPAAVARDGLALGGRTAPSEGVGPAARRDVRRRALEAQQIGLPDGAGHDWWAPCWERGVQGDLPADVLFDVLTRYRPDVKVLHRVAVPGTGATVDHVLIGSAGVVVVGTKRCQGKVKTDGVQLRVRGRDRSEVVDVALWQTEAIRSSLGRRALGHVAVHGVLHWEHLEGLGDRPICLRGIRLLSAGAALGLAATGNALSPHGVERVTATLAMDTMH